jgi:hypothetical protein
MDGNLFSSQGVKVAIVSGPSIFSLGGKKQVSTHSEQVQGGNWKES